MWVFGKGRSTEIEERPARNRMKAASWISVKDRLPDEPSGPNDVTECLVYVRWPSAGPMMLVAQFWGNTFSTPDYEERIHAHVTHWMPLPEPPEMSE